MNLLNRICARTTAFAVLFAVVTMGLSSCAGTGDKRGELLKNVSDDAIVVFTMNPSDYITSAGGNTDNGEITLPSMFEKLMKNSMSKREQRMFRKFTEANGLNLESFVCALYADRDDEVEPVVLIYMKDADKFAKHLQDNDFEEEKEDKMRCFVNEDTRTAVVFDGKIAWILGKCRYADEAADKVEEYKDDARKERLADWKRDYLGDKDKAFSVMVFLKEIPDRSVERMYDNKYINDDAEVLAAEMSLDGLHLTAAVRMFDKHGKEADLVSESDLESVNPDILSYFGKDMTAFGAVSVSGDIFKPFKAEMMEEFNKELVLALFGDDISKYMQSTYDSYYYYSYYSNPMRDSLRTIASSRQFVSPLKRLGSVGLGIGVAKGASFDINKQPDFGKILNASLVGSFEQESQAQNYFKQWNRLNLIGKEKSGDAMVFTPYYLNKARVYMNQKSSDVILSTDKKIEKTSHSFPSDLKNAVAFASVNLPKNGSLIKALPLKVNFGIKGWLCVTRNSAVLDLTLTDTDGGFLQNWLELAEKVMDFAGLANDSRYDAVEEVEAVCADTVCCDVADSCVVVAVEEYVK